MQIDTHLEIKLSVFDIKKFVENFNRDQYSQAKRYLIERLEKNFCSANPKDITLTLEDVFEQSGPCINFDENFPVEEIKNTIKDFWCAILPNQSEIEDAKSGRLIVYRDVEYTEELFFIDFEELT